jgi:hypothetical protein
MKGDDPMATRGDPPRTCTACGGTTRPVDMARRTRCGHLDLDDLDASPRRPLDERVRDGA